MKNTKQYITRLMHGSDPVAYGTLPFKGQTTLLDYKLHTDRASGAHHSHVLSAEYGKRKSSAASLFITNTHL